MLKTEVSPEVVQAPTSVLHSACKQGILEDVKKALANGADINARDANGNTALHLGILANNITIVEYLLDNRFESGLDYLIKNNSAENAIDLAIRLDLEGLPRCFKGTLDGTEDADAKQNDDNDEDEDESEDDAGKNDNDNPKKKRSAKLTEAECLDEITTALEVDHKYCVGERSTKALHLLLKVLRSQGLYTVDQEHNSEDPDGTTPLFLACKIGNWPVAMYLIKQGASLLKPYAQGKSPLEVIANIQKINGDFIKFLKFIAAECKPQELYAASFITKDRNSFNAIEHFALTHELDTAAKPRTEDSLAYYNLHHYILRIRATMVGLEGLLYTNARFLPGLYLQELIKSQETLLKNHGDELRNLVNAVVPNIYEDVVGPNMLQTLRNVLLWNCSNAKRLIELYINYNFVAFEVITKDYPNTKQMLWVLYDKQLMILNAYESPFTNANLLINWSIDVFSEPVRYYVINDPIKLLNNLGSSYGRTQNTQELFSSLKMRLVCIDQKPNDPTLFFREKTNWNMVCSSMWSNIVYNGLLTAQLRAKLSKSLIAPHHNISRIRDQCFRLFVNFHYLRQEFATRAVTTSPIAASSRLDYHEHCNGLSSLLLDETLIASILLPGVADMSTMFDSILNFDYLNKKSEITIFAVDVLMDNNFNLKNPLAEALKNKFLLANYTQNDLIFKEQKYKIGATLKIDPTILTQKWVTTAHLHALWLGLDEKIVKTLNIDQAIGLISGATLYQVQQPWFRGYHNLALLPAVVNPERLSILNPSQASAINDNPLFDRLCDHPFFDNLAYKTLKLDRRYVQEPGYIAYAKLYAADFDVKSIPSVNKPRVEAWPAANEPQVKARTPENTTRVKAWPPVNETIVKTMPPVDEPCFGKLHVIGLIDKKIQLEDLNKLNLLQLYALSKLNVLREQEYSTKIDLNNIGNFTTLDEIIQAELSFEKIALLKTFNNLSLASIKNDSAIQSTCSMLGYQSNSSQPFSLSSLFAFLNNITQDEVLNRIYNIAAPKLDGLNELQRIGLIIGFAYPDVTHPLFSLEKVMATLFLSASPRYIMKLSNQELSQILPKPIQPFIDKYASDIVVTLPAKIEVSMPLSNTDVAFIEKMDDLVIISKSTEVQQKPIDCLTNKSATTAFADQQERENHTVINQLFNIETDVDAQLLRFCQQYQWESAEKLLLDTNLNLRKEYACGKSPLQYIAFSDDRTPSYVNFIKFLSVYLAPDYKLSFTSQNKIWEPFMSALAAYQTLNADFDPLPTDDAKYHAFYKILRQMRLKTLIHNHAGMHHWYAAVDDLPFKPTGSVGAVMHHEFLNFHRHFFAFAPQKAQLFKYIRKQAPNNLAKKLKLDVLLNEVDSLFKSYFITNQNNLPSIIQKIEHDQPVIFEMQIMLPLLSHNFNVCISKDLLYVADRGETTIYKITNKLNLLTKLPTFFGRRVEQNVWEGFKKNPNNVKLLQKYETEMAEGWNCTLSSTHALYLAVVLERLHSLVNASFSSQTAMLKSKGLFAIAEHWSHTIRNYGFYFNLNALQNLCESPLQRSYEHYRLPVINDASDLGCIEDSAVKEKIEKFVDYLSTKFDQQLEKNAVIAGFKTKLSKFKSQNILYDLGPQAEANALSLTDKQILGLNYGLSKEIVTEPNFDPVNSKALLFYPNDRQRIQQLPPHKVAALGYGLSLDTIEQSWCTPLHAWVYSYLELDLATLSRLSHRQLMYLFDYCTKGSKTNDASPGLKDTSLVNPSMVDNYFFNYFTYLALKLDKSAISKEQILNLPGHIAYGLAKGLSMQEVLAPWFSNHIAGAISNGAEVADLKSMDNQQLRLIYCSDIKASDIKNITLEIDDLLLFCVRYELLNINLLKTKEDSYKYAFKIGCPFEIVSGKDFHWLQALAYYKGVTVDHIRTCTKLQLLLKIIYNSKISSLSDLNDDFANIIFLLHHGVRVSDRKPAEKSDSHHDNGPERLSIPLIECMIETKLSYQELQSLNDTQINLILRGLTIDEVKQPWCSTAHYAVCNKWGLNPRYLIGKTESEINKLDIEIQANVERISKNHHATNNLDHVTQASTIEAKTNNNYPALV